MEDELLRYHRNALAENLCKEWENRWKVCKNDKERLVALSLMQQSIPHFATFCAQKKGLSRKYILDNFGDYINGYTIWDAEDVEGYTYGLYVDYNPTHDLLVDKNVSHIMWTVGSTLVVPQTKCPIIYLSNRSNVHLVCEGYNSVKIYMFDSSNVTIECCNDDDSVTIYKYSDKCKVERGKYCLSSHIYEHRKELRL